MLHRRPLMKVSFLEFDLTKTRIICKIILTYLKNLGSQRFYLESQITDEEAKDLVDLTIARLQEVETPSLSKWIVLEAPFLTSFELLRRYNQIADRLWLSLRQVRGVTAAEYY